jgi:hypothetical protein
MRTLLTLIAGANLIALNLFIFFKVPNLEASSSQVAIALMVIYFAGFVGAAAGSFLYRR